MSTNVFRGSSEESRLMVRKGDVVPAGNGY